MSGIIQKRGTIYFTAIVLSILFSYFVFARQFVINPDAICYLQSAQSMSQGLSFAMHLCNQAHWPFYSLLIFCFASLTHLPLESSAYLLNGILTLLSVVAFIGIIQFFRDTQRLLWLATLVILSAHEFNAVRDYIVRDHGFWAFYLISILSLLHFYKTRYWRYAFAWGISLIIATLFRVEGVFLLIALPFTAWLSPNNKVKTFLKLNTLVILLIAAASIALIINPQLSSEHLGRIGEIKFQIANGLTVITQAWYTKSQALGQHVLSQYSTHDASLALCFLLVGMYFSNLIGNVSLVYAALIIYAWTRALLPAKPLAHTVLWTYILINILITSIFLIENMFLSKRYLIALTLTLLIWAPFALDALIQKWQKQKWPLAVAVFFIFVSGISGVIDFGASKKYISDSGHWLEINVPAKATLYSNDYQVMYYSNHFGNDIFAKQHELKKAINPQEWKNFDFLALRFDEQQWAKNAVLVKDLGTPVREFSNKRGDKVVIFKIR